MDIRKFLPSKRRVCEDQDDNSESESDSGMVEHEEMPDIATTSKSSKALSVKAAQKKAYKSKLTYRCQWESKYPWVYCNDTDIGMFCRLCQAHGKPPATARGGWTIRGIVDWNHATELLKLHNESKWHKDSAITARIADRGVFLSFKVLQLLGVPTRRRTKNRAVLLKLLRSVYFMVKQHISHTTNYTDLLDLQIANGDQVLEQHIAHGPANAQYTSKFAVTSLISAIDTWLHRKLVESLKKSPFFSILADECEDVSTNEELSVCC